MTSLKRKENTLEGGVTSIPTLDTIYTDHTTSTTSDTATKNVGSNSATSIILSDNSLDGDSIVNMREMSKLNKRKEKLTIPDSITSTKQPVLVHS